jgi:hypothetical protein
MGAPLAPVPITCSSNCSGEASRPCACSAISKAPALLARGAWPMAPAATCTFARWRAATTSPADRPRAATRSGSSQTRMA